MRIQYVIGKPWVVTARRHLVRTEGMPAEHGATHTTTVCGRELVGWVGPVVPIVGPTAEIDCEACLRTAAGRVLASAIAIEQKARKHR